MRRSLGNTGCPFCTSCKCEWAAKWSIFRMSWLKKGEVIPEAGPPSAAKAPAQRPAGTGGLATPLLSCAMVWVAKQSCVGGSCLPCCITHSCTEQPLQPQFMVLFLSVWQKSRVKGWRQPAGLCRPWHCLHRLCRPHPAPGPGRAGTWPTCWVTWALTRGRLTVTSLKHFQWDSSAACVGFGFCFCFFFPLKTSSPLLSIQMYFCSLLLLYIRVFFTLAILLLFHCILFLH